MEADVAVVDLPPEKERALNLALNRITGEWDIPKLRDVLDGLEPADLDLTGFEIGDLESLTALDVDSRIDPMDLKPPPKLVWILAGVPLTRFGDVQKHLATLEAHSDIIVQSTRD